MGNARAMMILMRTSYKIFLIVVGFIMILAAVPVAFLAELSIAGCCGAPTNGREGIGYLVGTIVGVVGIVIVALGIKYRHIRRP